MSFLGKIFGTAKKPSNKSKKDKDADLRALGIDPALFDDSMDFADDGTNEEFDEESLMSELSPKSRAQQKGKPSKASAVEPTFNFDDDDAHADNIQLNDNDLNDPDLLSSLKEISGSDWIEESPPPKPVAPKPTPVVPPKPVVKPVVEKPKQKDDDEAKMNAQLLKVENLIKEYKNAAVSAKKANNIDQAKKYLLTAKSLESQKETLSYGQLIDESKLPPSLTTAKPTVTKPPPVIPNKPTPSTIAPQPTTKQPPSTNTNKPNTTTSSSNNKSTNTTTKTTVAAPPPKMSKEQILSLLEERLEEYKQAALTAKKSNDIPTAKKYLAVYKSVLEMKENYEDGTLTSVSPNDIPASLKNPGKPSGSSTVSAPKSTGQQSAPAVEAEETSEDDPNPVENMVSNDVLEWAIKLVNDDIAKYKAAKKTIPDDLEDRKQNLEMALNMLVISVQSSKLTQDDYLDRMRQKITQERTSAKSLLQQGKKDWASLALQRAKIMEAEIQATLE